MNDLRNKLENETVLQWVHRHDVIILSEIKIAKLPHVPGFVPILAKTINTKRGGLAVLVRSSLYSDLCHIDKTYNDQLWFSFSSIPDVVFCGVYITPTSSPYFSEGDIANLQAKTIDHTKNYVIMGDLNARVGSSIHSVVDDSQFLTYKTIDPGINDSGKRLVDICKDHNLVLVNNLCTETATFQGALTFRQRNKWISELDLCIVSKAMIKDVKSFNVNQDTSLPSNHAPVSLQMTFPKRDLSVHQILTRASDIGSYPLPQKHLCKKPINYHRIDHELFTEKMSATNPTISATGHYDIIANDFSNMLYDTIKACKMHSPVQPAYDPAATRWERIMECCDDGLLWRAIDWKGQFDPENHDSESQPSELEFQEHLENLLHPSGELLTPDLSAYSTTIPILDDPIQNKEVSDVLDNQVKPNKGCGPDGNSPGVFKLLPGQWVLFLCFLFNIVFVAGYPIAWSSAKLVMLFKKGLRSICGNYRGISVINAVAKIYDYVLNNRLTTWYIPCREQAGSQSKRGCTEHFVTLRLLFDTFLRRRLKLFVVFVDFQKAYDLVPRSRLFEILIDLGCGITMLNALIAMYSSTTNILGSTVITSTIGVRQGSPTSCYLFVIFVDVLILLIKSKCSPEPILGWLHTLMLMDDTVILSTSREKMAEKLKLLDEYCVSSGMRLNESKTKFMVINGSPMDKIPFILSNLVIKHCTSYTYLGVIFTSDGRCTTSLAEHLRNKSKELNKLLIFFATNYDAPFQVKKRVLEAAFMSTILYGCESWLKVPLKPVNVMYLKAVRVLLGVRSTTPGNLCLIEAGLKPLECLVKQRQKNFYEKMLTSRSEMTDDPLMHAIGIAKEHNKPVWSYIQNILGGDKFSEKEIANMKETILNASPSATRFHTYISLNPTLEVHPLYTDKLAAIPDYLRISFTRFRLSSHMLKIETGRWCRTPREERLCECNTSIQDELHVFLCPLVVNLTGSFSRPCTNAKEFFDGTTVTDLKILHKILDRLSNNHNASPCD